MPAIAATNLNSSVPVTDVVTVLDGSDTLIYTPSNEPRLTLHNPTGGSITPTIIGDGATTAFCQQLGDIDVSSGYTFPAIGAGATLSIRLGRIGAYLVGNVSITSGGTLEATLYEN